MKTQTFLTYLGVLIIGGLLLAACGGAPTPAPATPNPSEIANSVNATLTAIAEQAPTEAPPTEPTSAPTEVPPEPTSTPPTPAESVEGDPAVILGKPDGIDTFDNANNWSTFNNECFANDIDNGKFVMDAKGIQRLACWTFSWPQMADFYMQTEVENPGTCQPDDSFGMIFRAPDNYKGYLFGLSCSGQIGLLNWDGETSTEIIPWMNDDVIDSSPGAVNRIGVAVFGSDYQLYANGKFVAEGQNFDYLDPGKIGYYVYASTNQGFTVKYDNLALWLLSDNYYPPGAVVPTPPPNPVPPPASGVPAATTITSVNVRSGPGTNYPIYFIAPPNTTFEVYGVSPDRAWWGVLISTDIVDHGEAWLSAAYVVTNNEVANVPVIQPPLAPPTVKPPEPPPSGETVIATNFEPLNVRSGPGNQYPSYGVAPIGSSAEVLGVSPDGRWYVIAVPDETPDGRGWVSANYITLKPANADLPVVQPPEVPPTVKPPKPPPSGETVIATATDVMNVFSGPGKTYSSYGKTEIGASAEAIGKSADGIWIAIAIPDIAPDGIGWVNARYVSLEPADAELPVLPAP